MRIETKKAAPNAIRVAGINRIENFSLANLTKNEIKLKISSNIFLKSPPAEILKQIISDNTFENPAYRSNEENNRSNWQTDPTITTYSYENETLVLPRGYMRDLLNIFRDNDITPQIADERTSRACAYPSKLNGVTLRPYPIVNFNTSI